jgi:hypothetical protein
MRAEEADDDLSGAEPVFDFLLPEGAGTDFVHIHPDVEPSGQEVLLETCCDLESVFSAVAEEDFWALVLGWEGGRFEGRWGEDFLRLGVGGREVLCGVVGGGGSGRWIKACFAGGAFPLGGLFLPADGC